MRDSRGFLVGPVMSVSNRTIVIARRVGDVVLTFGVSKTGFVSDPGGTQLYYEAEDCVGPPLMLLNPGDDTVPLVLPAFVTVGTAYYPTGTPTLRTRRSLAWPAVESPAGCPPGTLFLQPGLCCDTLPNPPTQFLAGTATVSIDTFGLLHPFLLDGL